MRSLDLRLRYLDRPVRMGVDESDFREKEIAVTLPLRQSALVLVDVWDSHHIASHFERCDQVTREKIAPLVLAAREAGMPVIHAPGPDVAAKYERCPSFGKKLAVAWFGKNPDTATAWPPCDEATHHAIAGAPGAMPAPADVGALRDARRIHTAVEPQADDSVVATAEELQAELAAREIRFLFYAGFAANICVPYRSYGMRAMQAAGYRVTLVRDATIAVETSATVASESLLAASIADVEMNYGSTISAGALSNALRS